MKQIDSRTNPEVKLLASLADRRAREDNKLFFFEGAHLLEDYLAAGLTPRTVYVNSAGAERFRALLDGLDEKTVLLSDSAFEKISTEKAPQGIITLSEFLPNVGDDGDCNFGSAAFLASLRDAGNVGTVLRSASALGMSGVVCSDDCADLYSPKTVRASMGALFRIKITVTNDISAAIKRRRDAGRRVYAAALSSGARILHDGFFHSGDSVVIGNEGQGLPESVIKSCDAPILIPMEAGCDSLNASAAAALLFWELRKARTEGERG